MPDDDVKTEEVTEQETGVVEGEETITPGGEPHEEALAGFNEPDDDSDDERSAEGETSSEKKSPYEDKETEDSKEKPPEESVKESEGEEETDEDEQRGDEILKKESDAEKEAREAEEKERERQEQAKAERESSQPPKAYTQNEIDVIHSVISNEIFPESIKLDDIDGISLREYVEDNPEMKTVSTIITKEVIDTLIRNEFLPSFKNMTEKIEELELKLANQRFLDKVTDKIPKAQEIFNSEDFNKWHDKQKDNIKALFRSEDPNDHIKGFRRFQKSKGLAKAQKKVVELDAKRAAEKEKADAIYKTTIKSRGKTQSTSSGLSPRDEAMEGFNSEDED